jgi:mannose-1-phosphate guanylyltransferase
MNFVILAGGGGTRLWPLSRKSRPKQFIKLFGNKTLIEMTYNRLRKIAKPEKIFIVANKQAAGLAKKYLQRIPAANYIIEPARRDTAPAIGLVCAKLFDVAADEPIAFIPSDHFITDEKLFCENVKTAEALINKTGKLVDIAITPTFPSTALGYTKIGAKKYQINNTEVFEFLGHKEKPEFEQAKKYIERGKYLWHASYYMWTPRNFLEAFKKYAPSDYENLLKIQNQKNKALNIVANFKKLTKISIDYAITEKIRPSEVLIIKGAFGWSDVGAFDVLYDAQQKKADKDGNVARGNFLGIDSSHCLVYGQPKKIIAAIGANNLAIIDTPDALLICPKNRSQEVKKIISQIKIKRLC